MKAIRRLTAPAAEVFATASDMTRGLTDRASPCLFNALSSFEIHERMVNKIMIGNVKKTDDESRMGLILICQK